MASNAIYSVWVGGVEVNDFYLTREAAATIAEEYSNDGYDDVFITATIEVKR